MKITTHYHRNFDLICFLNVATGDAFYTEAHEAAYKQFYPLLSDDIKAKIKGMVEKRETTMLWPLIALLLSAVDNHDSRDLVDILQSHDEIRQGIAPTPYFKKDTEKQLSLHFETYTQVVIPFVQALEAIGFVDYWEQEMKPLIEARCAQLNQYLETFHISDEVSRLMPCHRGDIRMWVCAFAHPLGAKLCGYDMISDYTWDDETILRTITHEMFHPPYQADKVAEGVKALGALPWVVAAYENQHPNHAYQPMAGFIEENIVEALGIYVFKKMIVDFDAHGYFKEHDFGSHVISPYFYDYLCNTPKGAEDFETYFLKFVAGLV